MLCPGQGSQSPDMLARLAADPTAAPFLRALTDHIDPETLTEADDPTRCYLNRNAQPLILFFGMTVASALREADVLPALVAGYSVGELTAHAVAGALAPASALALARTRAACMDAAAPPGHGMLAVRGVSIERLVARIADTGVSIAIRNSRDHAILAGPSNVLKELANALSLEFAAQVVPLPISVPAHTVLLADGVADFTHALEAANWQPHPCPVLCGMDGHPVSTAEDAIDSLARQIAAPLDWDRVMDIAGEMGTSVFFEIGPGDGLTRMARERFPDLPARALDDFASVDGAIAWLHRMKQYG